MPWTRQHYPASMKHLPPAVREKAIEIANALLDDGHPEGQAIRIAISRANQWGQRRSLLDADACGSGIEYAQ
jgi:uncharacterized protein YdaT